MRTVIVTTDRVTTDGVIVLTKGSYGVELTFNFIGDEWTGLIKKAVFNGVQRTIEGNKCKVPKEVTETTGNVRLGVYGLAVDGEQIAERISPYPTVISVIDGSFADGLTDAEDGEEIDENDTLIVIEKLIDESGVIEYDANF